MNNRLQFRFGWSFLALAALAASASGCKSAGFSMPGKNMFSRNRTPDAETLAGNNKVPNLPESPATKYDPSAMASLGSKPTSTPTGSAYGGGATQPGLAAAANGYQTGPYSTAPKNMPPAASVASTAMSGALPSPYGGSYNGSSASLSTPSTGSPTGDVPLPNSVAAAMSKGPGALGGYTPSATVGGSLPAFPGAAAAPALPGATTMPVGYASNAQTPAATSAYQLPTGPGAGHTPAFPASNSYTSTPVATVGSTSGLPSLPSASPPPTASGSQLASPATPASGGSTASSAYQGSTTLSPYSPGSTGRSTSYDFSGGNAGGASTGPSATGTSPLGTSTGPGGSLPLLR